MKTRLGWAPEIADHWKVVPLGYIARMGTGHTPDRNKSEYWNDCTIPWVTTPDVTRRPNSLQPLMDTDQKISEGGLANSAAVLHSAGTVMLSRTASVGYSVVIGRPMATTQAFVTWRAGALLEPDYLLLVLRSMKPEWSRLAYGSTHLTIYMPDLESLRIPLPPLDEQRRIVHFVRNEVERIDELIRLRQRSRALVTERARRAIATLATRGRGSVRFTGDPWIPEVAEGWDVVALKRRWRIVDCKHRTPAYVDEGYPVISPGDVVPGRLDLTRAHRFVGREDYLDLADDLRRVRRGEIVYGRNASVGVASFVDTDEPFTMGQDVCRIFSPDQDQLFLTYFLNEVASQQLGSMQIGTTFTRVNIGTLLELSIACPPVREQRQLAAEMDLIAGNAHVLTSSIDRQLDVLAERREALIIAAVTGQIDVSTASGVTV